MASLTTVSLSLVRPVFKGALSDGGGDGGARVHLVLFNVSSVTSSCSFDYPAELSVLPEELKHDQNV